MGAWPLFTPDTPTLIPTLPIIRFPRSLLYLVPITNCYQSTLFPWPYDDVSMQCTDVQLWYLVITYASYFTHQADISSIKCTLNGLGIIIQLFLIFVCPSPIFVSHFLDLYFFRIMMSHGLHESWQGQCRESFRIHGQLALADIGDSYYFLGSANVGRKRRRMSDISLYIRIWRLVQYFRDDE